jgi:chromosome segregation ATPase
MALDTARNIITQLVNLAKKLKTEKAPLQAQVLDLTARLSVSANEKALLQNQLTAALANDAADAATIEAARAEATQAQQQAGLIQEQLDATRAEYERYVAADEAEDKAIEDQLNAGLSALTPEQ